MDLYQTNNSWYLFEVDSPQIKYKKDKLMYKCMNCGSVFDDPDYYYETHGLDNPPYEQMWGCPDCKGDFQETFFKNHETWAFACCYMSIHLSSNTKYLST